MQIPLRHAVTYYVTPRPNLKQNLSPINISLYGGGSHHGHTCRKLPIHSGRERQGMLCCLPVEKDKWQDVYVSCGCFPTA